MSIELLNIGLGNMVSVSRIIAIVSPESAPIKRIIQDVRERGDLIDATCGRRTRSVVIMDSGHVVLSPLQPETLNARLEQRNESAEEEIRPSVNCVDQPPAYFPVPPNVALDCPLRAVVPAFATSFVAAPSSVCISPQ